MEETQLRDIVDKLSANDKVMGLVQMMQPLDIIAVISDDLDLQKDVAINVVANLIKNGMASPGIESNKDFPVPAKIRRDNELDEYDINNTGQANPDIKIYHFPPAPRSDPEEWPYDAMTKAAMEPANKTKKKPLLQGKNPLDPDMRKNRPGGDAGANALQSTPAPHSDGTTGSTGYDYKGRPGWSSTPPGKEFDLPTDGSPVGSAIPQFQGGHSQQRRMGLRRR